MSFLKEFRWPILSGVLYVLTQCPPFPPWSQFFCFVPLWFFWWRQRDSLRRILISGWICQFIYSAGVYHWVPSTLTQYGLADAPWNVLLFLTACSVGQLFVPTAGFVWWITKKYLVESWQVTWMALTFVTVQVIFPNVFPLHAAYGWVWGRLPGAQLAEWVGFWGLYLVCIVVNLALLQYWLRRQARYFIFGVLFFLGVNLLGLFLKTRFVPGDQTLKILAVQGSISNALKMQQEKNGTAQEYITQVYTELTEDALKRYPDTQLIIWPETAFPEKVVTEPGTEGHQARLRQTIKKWNVPLLTGAYQGDSRGDYNVLALFDSRGDLTSVYKKTILLPFGEYFPAGRFFPSLKKIFPGVGNFLPGLGPSLLQTEPASPRLGGQICYEAIFDGFSKKLVDKDVQIIVNVSNDSWFGQTNQPYGHLFVAFARALEFRVPVVRVANTGLTSVMSADGEWSQISPLHEPWTQQFTVNYKNQTERTVFYHLAGRWVWILLSLWAGILLASLSGRFRA